MIRKQILRPVVIENVECTLPFLFCLCRKWKHSWENRLFRQHANTAKHKRQSPHDPALGQAILQMTLTLKFIEDPAVWVHIQSAWWLAKEDVAIHKFGFIGRVPSDG